MPPTTLQTSTDYRPALLWLMGELGSARAAEVMNEFEQRFGHLISPEHQQLIRNGRTIKWQHYLRWARQHLTGAGLMSSGGYGIWTITKAGHDWLRTHPDGGKKALLAFTSAGQRKSSTPQVELKSTVPLANNNRDNQNVHNILDQQIDQIKGYLRGRLAPPSDELLCEWVHFCYTFQLYQEGAEIFKLINPTAVNPWPYERAKRLAKVCQMRANIA